ncbi:hypothetical protein G6F40_017372 [Rhizopus arrhizus]|nr:hypothetical protein G6F32_017026 [Rhizopus arrhizus]KAG1076056.1 hypothetical protein G6F40_017372 [Rhizopus arrhizus]
MTRMTSFKGIWCRAMVATRTIAAARGSVASESKASRSLISGLSNKLPKCSAGMPRASRPSAMAFRRALDAHSTAWPP